MKLLGDLFKRMIAAFSTKPEGNAWDSYKRARAMELAPLVVSEEEPGYPARRRFYERRFH